MYLERYTGGHLGPFVVSLLLFSQSFIHQFPFIPLRTKKYANNFIRESSYLSLSWKYFRRRDCSVGCVKWYMDCVAYFQFDEKNEEDFLCPITSSLKKGFREKCVNLFHR